MLIPFLILINICMILYKKTLMGMRDLALFAHVVLGFALITLSVIILLGLKNKSPLVRPLSALSTGISWFLLLPAGYLYLIFYPATKTLIKAGSWPWAHSVIMETKEHWGLLLPLIVTVAAALVFNGRQKESRNWWLLVIVLTAMLAILGRIVKVGALA
jgi:uncharacterized membrane protein